MEEKPPTQAGRDVPRSRTPRSAFGTPDQPTPPSKPTERSPRRTKAAPAVTFQPPANEETASADSAASPANKPAQRRSQPEQVARPAAKKAKKAAAETSPPAKPAAKAAPPADKAAAEPAKAAPAKRAPKKVPAQATTAAAIDAAAPRSKPARPRKATAKATAASDRKPTAQEPVTAVSAANQSDAVRIQPASDAVPAQPAADAVPAQPAADAVQAQPAADAVPAQPAADATPPARAMPAEATPAETTPVNVADDPVPAQAIADATQPAKAAPAESPQGGAERSLPTTFSKLAADPGHAPELLALAAVQTIGPRAKEWARRIQEAYPKASDNARARLAADQFTRFSSPSSIVAAIAGAYSPAALIATTALTHARVILHVAAAYGIDPTDEARAADLLVLTRVYSSREDAEAAVTAAKQSARHETNAVRRVGRMVATNAAGWVAVRLVRRYFPGSGVLAAALVSRSSGRNMAERANTYYSQASHALGRSV